MSRKFVRMPETGLPPDEPWARRTLHLCARDFGALSVPAASLAQGLRETNADADADAQAGQQAKSADLP